MGTYWDIFIYKIYGTKLWPNYRTDTNRLSRHPVSCLIFYRSFLTHCIVTLFYLFLPDRFLLPVAASFLFSLVAPAVLLPGSSVSICIALASFRSWLAQANIHNGNLVFPCKTTEVKLQSTSWEVFVDGGFSSFVLDLLGNHRNLGNEWWPSSSATNNSISKL